MQVEFSLDLTELKGLSGADAKSAPMAEVVALAKAGDPAAFERLLVENEKMVLNTAYKLLGNLDDARDAAQEVFLRFHRSLRSFDAQRPVAPWLYRIAVNVCREMGRKRSRRNEVSLDLEMETSEKLHTGREDFDVNVERSQQRRILAELLERLPLREREAIVLRDIEGLDTSKVAEILNVRAVTVRSALSSARNKLRLAFLRRVRRTS